MQDTQQFLHLFMVRKTNNFSLYHPYFPIIQLKKKKKKSFFDIIVAKLLGRMKPICNLYNSYSSNWVFFFFFQFFPLFFFFFFFFFPFFFQLTSPPQLIYDQLNKERKRYRAKLPLPPPPSPFTLLPTLQPPRHPCFTRRPRLSTLPLLSSPPPSQHILSSPPLKIEREGERRKGGGGGGGRGRGRGGEGFLFLLLLFLLLFLVLK